MLGFKEIKEIELNCEVNNVDLFLFLLSFEGC